MDLKWELKSYFSAKNHTLHFQFCKMGSFLIHLSRTYFIFNGLKLTGRWEINLKFAFFAQIFHKVEIFLLRYQCTLYTTVYGNPHRDTQAGYMLLFVIQLLSFRLVTQHMKTYFLSRKKYHPKSWMMSSLQCYTLVGNYAGCRDLSVDNGL